MAGTVTISFLPGQILHAGDTITITTPQPLTPAAAEYAIRLLYTGNPVTISLTISDQTIKFSTTDLQPGYYELAISKLKDSADTPETRPLVIRPPARGLLAEQGPNLIVEHVLDLAIGELSAKLLAPGEKTPAGSTYVQRVKATAVSSGLPVTLDLDSAGKTIDAPKLLADMQVRRFEKFGRVHEDLFKRVGEMGPEESVEIVVWPRVTGVPIGSTKAQSAEDSPQLEKQHQMRADIVEKLQSLDAKISTADLEVPKHLRYILIWVRASLPVKHLQSLAASPAVGGVFYDNRSAILDLADSIAVARSDVAHSRGFTGKGVRVAVFEDGPADTSDLVFFDRFSSSPPNSDHARLVSAIIKNTQSSGPHGHAPDCSLFSANSESNDAIVRGAIPAGCTVINQSFHRDELEEEDTAVLSADDILKDWLAVHHPYPTIVHAAGNTNSPDTEFVNHKGFNTLSVGSHDDAGNSINFWSARRNPGGGDRELPEICANGDGVFAVNADLSGINVGTSFAAPAVAGVAALIQGVDSTLKSWPEGCRAVLLAGSSRSRIASTTWWADVASRTDAAAGAGALDAKTSVAIARNKVGRNNVSTARGFHFGSLADSDFDPTTRIAMFRLNINVPRNLALAPESVKVVLAWNAKVETDETGPVSSRLGMDLDLRIVDHNGNLVAWSSSWNNSYEVVEFAGWSGRDYSIQIRRSSGTGSTWFGVAWTVGPVA